jgi:SAM-dependent methyltransferase
VNRSQHVPGSVEILSPVRESSFPSDWYDLNARDHFWFRWRFAALRRLLTRTKVDLRAPKRTLDVGCGVGILRDQLEDVTAWTVDGVDLNLHALDRAKKGRGTLFYYDISAADPRFTAQYDCVSLFDVLEHIEDTGPFITSVARLLRANGMLFVNVPALESLRSEYDTAAGHCRRYDIRTLSREFEGSGLKVKGADYWGFSLVPLLLARKVLTRHHTDQALIIREGFQPPSRWINRLLGVLAEIECGVLRHPPLGTSVLMALQRI